MNMNKIWIFFSGSASASQPVVGIDSSQLFGRKKRSESDGKKKIAQKMKNKEFARFSNGKQSSQKISRKQTRIKEAKGSRKQSRQSLRKGQRNAKRKSAKTAERKKKRKRKRKLSGKNARKGKRRKRRKQKRAKLRKIEESRLGKPIPKEKVEIFRENFQRGKEKAGKEKGFLKSVENPFEKLGRLRADFRQLVRDKVLIWKTHGFDFSSLISQVIEKLPGYCEQGRMMEKREKSDCARRARRIRERIEKRKTDTGWSNHMKILLLSIPKVNKWTPEKIRAVQLKDYYSRVQTSA